MNQGWMNRGWMNPLPMVMAEFRGLRWIAVAIVTLVALAVAIGVGINAEERAFRKGSAQAADDFDLVIGAPGSAAQLVLTTVFLQQEALPLMPGAVLPRLLADKRVSAAAPIALGDIASGYPIVGTTRAFLTRWGRIAFIEGRAFERLGEAVLGADVALPLGAEITPAHATAGMSLRAGEMSPEEHGHRHEAARYVPVGRLPRLGTPWDKAILVPIESVWSVHGLASGANPGPNARLPWPKTAPGGEETPSEVAQALPEPPLEASLAPAPAGAPASLPGIPAIVVKPRGVADAYSLRSAYRQGGTMAFFPAELLVSLYGALGDVRDLLLIASILNTILIFSAILLLLWTIAGLRRKRYAILRALGAPQAYILLVVWLNAVLLLTLGCAVGLFLGWGASAGFSHFTAAVTGLQLDFVFDPADIRLVLALVGLGSMMALIPALLSYRLPVITALRAQG